MFSSAVGWALPTDRLVHLRAPHPPPPRDGPLPHGRGTDRRSPSDHEHRGARDQCRRVGTAHRFIASGCSGSRLNACHVMGRSLTVAVLTAGRLWSTNAAVHVISTATVKERPGASGGARDKLDDSARLNDEWTETAWRTKRSFDCQGIRKPRERRPVRSPPWKRWDRQ